MVAVKGAQDAISIVKKAGGITVEPVALTAAMQPDLTFTTRYSYLRRALTVPFGHETIFVGSGGIWSYRDRATAATHLHRELAVLLRQKIGPPPSRFGDQPRWRHHAKQAIKRLMGKRADNLYDLEMWTVYE